MFYVNWLGVAVDGRRWWDGGRRRRSVYYPHAMRAGCAKFGHCVCQGAERCDMEDWERVFAICQSAFGENHGDKVDAAR